MSSVRERDALRERKKYPLWEKNLPKNHVSSLIGVTSHTTPLPVGEGLGEGPPPHGLETVRKWVLLDLWVLWGIKLPSVLPAGCLIERKATCNRMCLIWDVKKIHSSVWEDAPLPCRRRLLSTQNTPFLHAEHALLELRKASSFFVFGKCLIRWKLQ